MSVGHIHIGGQRLEVRTVSCPFMFFRIAQHSDARCYLSAGGLGECIALVIQDTLFYKSIIILSAIFCIVGLSVMALLETSVCDACGNRRLGFIPDAAIR